MLHIGFLLAAILLDQFTSLGKTGCQAARASEWAGRRCRMEIGGGEDGFAEGALRATEAGEGVELSAASDAMSSLDALQARLDGKLKALGASDVAPYYFPRPGNMCICWPPRTRCRFALCFAASASAPAAVC